MGERKKGVWRWGDFLTPVLRDTCVPVYGNIRVYIVVLLLVVVGEGEEEEVGDVD